MKSVLNPACLGGAAKLIFSKKNQDSINPKKHSNPQDEDRKGSEAVIFNLFLSMALWWDVKIVNAQHQFFTTDKADHAAGKGHKALNCSTK